MRFVLRLSVGQQLGLLFAFCALPLAYLGYSADVAGSDATGLAFAVAGLVACGALCFAVASASLGDPIDAALATLGVALKARVEATDATALTAGRLRGALDRLTTNVMVADADGKIIDMNDVVGAMFTTNATEIRKQLPHFDPDKVLGPTSTHFARCRRISAA